MDTKVRPHSRRRVPLSMVTLLGMAVVPFLTATNCAPQAPNVTAGKAFDMATPAPSAPGAPGGMMGAGPAAAEFGATQGGVKDIAAARELINAGHVPPPEAFKVEGLFSEHDLPLEGQRSDRLFALKAGTGVTTTEDKPSLWVQLGMSSNFDPEEYHRPPLTFVACVDVSGSMGWDYASGNQNYGTAGALARKLLDKLVDALDQHDRLAIVSYGSECRLNLDYTSGGSHATLHKAVAELHEAGSTNMEAGLKLAYKVAGRGRRDKAETRVLLFTDEQPNVGHTDAGSFQQMVRAGADEQIGLTVFGLGLGLNSDLTAEMSHLRGGNAYSLTKAAEIDKLCEDEWPWFATPIAYKLHVDLSLSPGLELADTYGFPAPKGQETPALDVATVFLSKRKGAMLLRFQPAAGARLQDLRLSARLSYETTTGEQVGETLGVSFAHARPGQDGRWFSQPGVRKTVALARLGTALRSATEDYPSDPKGAAKRLEAARAEFDADRHGLDAKELDSEADLARRLAELMAVGKPQGNLYPGGGER
ncbi:MAG: VWA domain-containing protein [Armatimonadetes bacterium]|nr:VWA domain-containing protein [Armatimonadota bacterium]